MAAKRLVRSYEQGREKDYISSRSDIRLRTMWPEIAEFNFGMDGEVKLGHNDLRKLGWPKRIKVVIYNIDD